MIKMIIHDVIKFEYKITSNMLELLSCYLDRVTIEMQKSNSIITPNNIF